MKKLLKKSALLILALTFALSALTGALAETICGYVDVTGASVNIRKGPSLDYSSTKVINAGETPLYLGETSMDERGVVWYKVNSDGTTGWISSRYGELHQRMVVAIDGQTYIRSYGSLQASQLDVLPEDASANFMEASMLDDRGVAWYKVNYNGTIGWVSSKYTQVVEQSEPAYNRIVEAADGQTRLRTAPNLNGNEICIMKKGDSATYLNDSSVDERGVVWYKVLYGEHSGWVSSKYTVLY